MKTNYFFVMLFVFGISLMGCDEDNEGPLSEEQTEQTGNNNEPNDKMYFPRVGSDEWETKSALEIGWDTTDLSEAIRYAREKNSYNLLIIHKGKMIVEEYWKETNAASKHNLESVTKSLMAFVIGVLQEDGTVKIDHKVNNYLAEGWSQSPQTESEITLRHLLTMTSGLNEELKYIGPPGETWRYSHAAYKVLYNVIDSASGMAGSYRRLFESVLFSKIGMKDFEWVGREVASNARDIARFGLMIMNRGVWNGEKLIKDDGYFSDMLSTSQSAQQAYGYLWWVNGTDTWYDDDNKMTVDGPIAASMPADSWLAKGKHDQRIYIVPSLDLVVIRQGGYNALPEAGEGSFDFEFWKRLMKAMNQTPDA